MSYNIYNKATDSLEEIAGNVNQKELAKVSAKVDLVDAKIEADDTYSTEEVKTNKTWINGKPIYRKVIKFTLTTGTSATIEADFYNANNIDEIISLQTVSVATGTNASVAFGNYYQGTNDLVRIYITSSNALTVLRGSNYPTLPLTLTIITEYTKK